MPTLGGSIFVRNAIKYDYCIRESIASLAALCDEVFILDCQSDDGTTEMLDDYVKAFPHVRYYKNGNWNCADTYRKLAMLANDCINALATDWHIMLQADEVIHEDSFPMIRQLVNANQNRNYAVRRLNLFGDVDHHIRFDLDQKPCSDQPIRLAMRHVQAMGDAESLDWGHYNGSHINDILIYHYGYVRHDKMNIDKAVDMQGWFNGANSSVDGRILEMQKTGIWEPYKLMDESKVTPIPKPHPMFSKAWADERRKPCGI